MFRVTALLFGVLAYGLFGVSLIWLLAFLTNIGLPLTLDRGDISPPINPFVWNIFLLTLFGLQHSIMARPGFKRWWTRHIPATIERSTYVFISSILVLAICLFWKPIPGIVWQAESTAAQIAWWAGFVIGFFWLIGSSFLIDHFELLGLKQVWYAARRRSMHSLPFVVRGVYRLVRHPIYVGWLLLFWCTPVMSWGHLLFAAGMTVYTIIAIRHEERDLMQVHGETYIDYKKKVPALLPSVASLRGFFSGHVVLAIGLVAVLCVSTFLLLGPEKISRAGQGIAITLETAAMERVIVQSRLGPRRAVLANPKINDPRRLLVLLHGAGGDANRLRLLTSRRFETLAEAAGWLVVYPEGYGGTWNDCRTAPDYPAKRMSVDDVAFLEELVAGLRKRYGIAAENVLVGGFSNGGHMAFRFAAERAGQIGGIAVVGA